MRPSLRCQSPERPDYQAFFDQLSGLCTYPVPPAAPLRHETVFQQLLLDTMRTERPGEFRRFRRLLYQAMVYFRQMKAGNLTRGFAGLQTLRNTLPPLLAETRLLGEALLTPMLAYYYFRTGDYPTASAYNQRAVAISSELQPAYPVLHWHQIQQQLNLSRIDTARHRYTDALHTSKALIDYLIMGRLPNLTGGWTTGLRAGLSAALIDTQLVDILNELVFITLKPAGLAPTRIRAVLADAGQWLSARPVVVPSPATALLIWWQSCRHDADGQQQLFLADVSALIAHYPAGYDHLKLLLLGRLHFLMAHSGSTTADGLALIRRFVNTRLQLSPRLRQHIRTSRSQRLAG